MSTICLVAESFASCQNVEMRFYEYLKRSCKATLCKRVQQPRGKRVGCRLVGRTDDESDVVQKKMDVQWVSG
jgi:hypothetical protein